MLRLALARSDVSGSAPSAARDIANAPLRAPRRSCARCDARASRNARSITADRHRRAKISISAASRGALARSIIARIIASRGGIARALARRA